MSKLSDEKKKVELIATLIAGPKNGFVDARKLRRHLERDEIFWLTVMWIIGNHILDLK